MVKVFCDMCGREIDYEGQVETFRRYKLERLAGRIEEVKEHEHE